jgi:hypothetical protein
MILDLTNIPEDFDYRMAYNRLSDKYHEALLVNVDLNLEFQKLNDKYQIDLSNDALIIAKYKQSAQTLYDALKRWTTLAGDKAPESDLAALKNFDSLMLEMANSTVSSNQ